MSAALATIFAALFLGTAVLFVIAHSTNGDLAQQLRDERAAHAETEAELAASMCEANDLLALINVYSPVPYRWVDISADVADLHECAGPEEIRWEAAE